MAPASEPETVRQTAGDCGAATGRGDVDTASWPSMALKNSVTRIRGIPSSRARAALVVLGCPA